MKSRMCKIKLDTECYFVTKVLQMVSAVQEDTFWKRWEGRVKNGSVVTILALTAGQQNNYALTTQCSGARTEASRSQEFYTFCPRILKTTAVGGTPAAHPRTEFTLP